MLQNRQKKMRAFIVTVGLITTLCFIIVPGVGRQMMKRDYANALPQQGVATVALIVEERYDVGRDVRYPPKVLVRFHGDVHRVRKVTPDDIVGLEVNQQARITYRIGKTGRVYVDNIAPMSSENPVLGRVN
jgi:hypothetical protein